MQQPATVTPTRLFLYYLGLLKGLLDKAEAFGADVGNQRLHATMFPLLQQAKTAIGFTLRTACPLAGRPIVSFRDDEDGFASVFRELAATEAYLRAIPDADFDGIDATRVDTVAGFAALNLSGPEYYLMYALPNFFFHYAMVYAIARQAGVPVGKPDFDGFHQYPPGFSFG
jgi:hypothetical protein